MAKLVTSRTKNDNIYLKDVLIDDFEFVGGLPSSSSPLYDSLYVDATVGLDNVSNDGSYSKPWATVDYAVTNAVVNFSITATSNATTTLSGISDVHYALLLVNKTITGLALGIPYGSIIISKNGGSTDAKTITISKACTLSATDSAYVWSPKWLRITGDIKPTANIFKEGLYPWHENGTCVLSNFALVSNTLTKPQIPYYAKFDKVWGNQTNSMLYNEQITYCDTNHICNIDYNTIDLVTGVATNGWAMYRSCAVGYAGYYSINGKRCTTVGSGFYIYSQQALTIKTDIYAVGSSLKSAYGLTWVISEGYFKGSNFDTWGSNHTGTIEGYGTFAGTFDRLLSTLGTIGGGSIINKIESQAGEITLNSSNYGESTVVHEISNGGSASQKLTCSASKLTIGTMRNGWVDVLNNGFVTVLQGGHTYYNSNKFSISSGQLVLNGSHSFYGTYISITGGVVINNGVITGIGGVSISAGQFINKGLNACYYNTVTGGIYHSGDMSGDYDLAGNLSNYQLIEQTGGLVVVNGTLTQQSVNVAIPVIVKSGGQLQFTGAAKILTANGMPPIKCSANTSASKDIYVQSLLTNCNYPTVSVEQAFTGGFAPNLLLRNSLYESSSIL